MFLSKDLVIYFGAIDLCGRSSTFRPPYFSPTVELFTNSWSKATKSANFGAKSFGSCKVMSWVMLPPSWSTFPNEKDPNGPFGQKIDMLLPSNRSTWICLRWFVIFPLWINHYLGMIWLIFSRWLKQIQVVLSGCMLRLGTLVLLVPLRDVGLGALQIFNLLCRNMQDV